MNETLDPAGSDVYAHIDSITDIDTLRRVAKAWVDTSLQHLRNEDYYRGLVEACGEAIGPEAYIQDDGGVVDSPLCAKVPELVARLVVQHRDAVIACENAERVIGERAS